MDRQEYFEFLEKQPHYDWTIIFGRYDGGCDMEVACTRKECLQRMFAAVLKGADWVAVMKR